MRIGAGTRVLAVWRLLHQHSPSHLGRFPNKAEGTAHPFSGTSSSGLTQIASNVPTTQAPHGEVPFHPTAFLRAVKRRIVSSQPAPLDDKGLAESESWCRASRKFLSIPQSCSPTISGGLFSQLRTLRDVRHQCSNRLVPGERPTSVVDTVFTTWALSFPRWGPWDEGVLENSPVPKGLARRAQEWIRLHHFAARNTPALSYFETPSSCSDPTFTQSGMRRNQPAMEGLLATTRAALNFGIQFHDRS
ncbi:hypothetical protein R1flu_007968 [Riccia fluitans]|uniref:Uncharacterized protein n=1 Tax=Riccia fluitans TaxID=41844 RepID=A0ABD1YAD9_9MARC